MKRAVRDAAEAMATTRILDNSILISVAFWALINIELSSSFKIIILRSLGQQVENEWNQEWVFRDCSALSASPTQNRTRYTEMVQDYEDALTLLCNGIGTNEI